MGSLENPSALVGSARFTQQSVAMVLCMSMMQVSHLETYPHKVTTYYSKNSQPLLLGLTY